MEIKGTPVVAMSAFLREKFGDKGSKRWLSALSEEAAKVHGGSASVGSWYPLKRVMLTPLLTICVLFYEGKPRGAWECGRFTAERDLGGVLGMFGGSRSLEGLIQVGGTILSTFFRPSPKVTTEVAGKSGVLRVSDFSELDRQMEFYIGGWVERALEFIGCKDVKMEQTKSVTKSDPVTEYRASWQ